MHKLSDFNSLFELGFGINALVFIFEILPWMDGRFETLLFKYEQLYNAAQKAGWDLYAFTPATEIRQDVRDVRGLMMKLAIVESLLSLGYLLVSAFSPGTTIHGLLAGFLILVVLVPIPYVCFRIILIPLHELEDSAIPPLQRRTDGSLPPPGGPPGPPA